MKLQPLPRRTFLRGLGTLLALPALEAMVPARAFAQASSSPSRFVAVWFSNGVVQKGDPDTVRNHWGCKGTEHDWALSRTLQPLAPLKSQISVVDGLYNSSLDNIGGAAHWTATTSFLAGQKHNPSGLNLLKPGRSIDEEIADLVGSGKKLRSLHMGAQTAASAPAGDHRGTGVYLSNVSWKSQNELSFRHESSRNVFTALFGNGVPHEVNDATRLQREGRLSILDLVRDDATRLKARLGASDRQRLDQFMTSVREVEQGIEAETEMGASTCVVPEQSLYESESYQQRVRNMTDLMIRAFECDLTRVCTFMIDNEHNYLSLSQSVGGSHTGKHHDVSHYDMNNALAAATEINKWQVTQLAALLTKMRDLKDLEGKSLLDTSFVLYGSGLGDGDGHLASRTPVVIAGSLHGKVQQGRLIKTNGAPYANLLAGITAKFGGTASKWGDGTGSLTF